MKTLFFFVTISGVSVCVYLWHTLQCWNVKSNWRWCCCYNDIIHPFFYMIEHGHETCSLCGKFYTPFFFIFFLFFFLYFFSLFFYFFFVLLSLYCMLASWHVACCFFFVFVSWIFLIFSIIFFFFTKRKKWRKFWICLRFQSKKKKLSLIVIRKYSKLTI